MTPKQAADRPADHRTKPRRRGEVLQRAIFEATLAELAEAGYAELAMARVAERARTSKASLYRRWSNRAELVLDAFRHAIPGTRDLPDSGDLREDLLTLLRTAAELLAGPLGEAVRGMIAEAVRDPDHAGVAQARSVGSSPDLVLAILRRAAGRGEVRSDALTLRVAGVGPALLKQHFLVHGAPIPDQVLTEIVDEVVLPLVSSRAG
ncbi:MAG: TetR family transcriptional regulator [Propionibacteriales bacterium]|nr:TetR family transcriptional regulator [Propionibacteriales bacterium]